MSETEATNRFDWKEIIVPKNGQEIPPDTQNALTKYFEQFADTDGKCPGCGELIFGKDMVGSLFATFRWGLAHGHGNCSCGWPAIVHHSIPDLDGEEMMTLRNFGLILHPDFVKRAAPKGDA